MMPFAGPGIDDLDVRETDMLFDRTGGAGRWEIDLGSLCVKLGGNPQCGGKQKRNATEV